MSGSVSGHDFSGAPSPEEAGALAPADQAQGRRTPPPQTQSAPIGPAKTSSSSASSATRMPRLPRADQNRPGAERSSASPHRLAHPPVQLCGDHSRQRPQARRPQHPHTQDCRGASRPASATTPKTSTPTSRSASWSPNLFAKASSSKPAKKFPTHRPWSSSSSKNRSPPRRRERRDRLLPACRLPASPPPSTASATDKSDPHRQGRLQAEGDRHPRAHSD
jgi:hypothetical protein